MLVCFAAINVFCMVARGFSVCDCVGACVHVSVMCVHVTCVHAHAMPLYAYVICMYAHRNMHECKLSVWHYCFMCPVSYHVCLDIIPLHWYC